MFVKFERYEKTQACITNLIIAKFRIVCLLCVSCQLYQSYLSTVLMLNTGF